MATGRTITLALSTGDPLGIGPEVCRAALATPPRGVKLETFGTLETWKVEGARVARADAGRASFEALMGAVEAVKRGECDGLVTGPISKEAWHAAGVTAHAGHT
ncbi:MAG: 4-hydroxythreonine-4-phosphate dehydrogenase PdxA, partial [Phycisphaerales bacterium]|nr:4-hydroxythreonine-4-phosphate dehydrogenase PdxA [Phycisphaerales bacterium]